MTEIILCSTLQILVIEQQYNQLLLQHSIAFQLRLHRVKAM